VEPKTALGESYHNDSSSEVHGWMVRGS